MISVISKSSNTIVKANENPEPEENFVKVTKEELGGSDGLEIQGDFSSKDFTNIKNLKMKSLSPTMIPNVKVIELGSTFRDPVSHVMSSQSSATYVTSKKDSPSVKVIKETSVQPTTSESDEKESPVVQVYPETTVGPASAVKTANKEPRFEPYPSINKPHFHPNQPEVEKERKEKKRIHTIWFSSKLQFF